MKRMKIPVELELQYDRFQSQMGQMSRSLQQDMRRVPRQSQAGMMSDVMFPQGGNMRRSVRHRMRDFSRTLSLGFKQEMPRMSRMFTQSSKGVADFGKMGKKSFDELGKAARKARRVVEKELNAIRRAQSRMGSIGGGGGGSRPVALRSGGAASMGGRARGYAAQGMGWLSTLGVYGMQGIITGGIQQAVGAYENREDNRLEWAPYMTGGAGRGRNPYISGRKYGYTPAEAAQLQGTGSKLGMGRSAEAGDWGFQLMRGWGQEGFTTGAGMMRRGRGTKTAKQEFIRIFAAGIKSGLDEGRIPELLEGANRLSEEIITVTPKSDGMKAIVQQLAMMNSSGRPGLMGKYGASALGQMDKSIRGSSGASQAFLLRAFGFGRGTSFFDAYRRMEQGASNPENIRDILAQGKREYGTGKYGGGTARETLLALKNFGMKSTFVAEDVARVYSGSGSLADKQSQIQAILRGDKDGTIGGMKGRGDAHVQRWGRPSRLRARDAERYARVAEKGKGKGQHDLYSIKERASDVAYKLLGSTGPLIKKVVLPFSKWLVEFMEKNKGLLKDIVGGFATFVRVLGGAVGSLVTMAIKLGRKFGLGGKPTPKSKFQTGSGQWKGTGFGKLWNYFEMKAADASRAKFLSGWSAQLKKDPAARKKMETFYRGLVKQGKTALKFGHDLPYGVAGDKTRAEWRKHHTDHSSEFGGQFVIVPMGMLRKVLSGASVANLPAAPSRKTRAKAKKGRSVKK